MDLMDWSEELGLTETRFCSLLLDYKPLLNNNWKLFLCITCFFYVVKKILLMHHCKTDKMTGYTLECYSKEYFLKSGHFE